MCDRFTDYGFMTAEDMRRSQPGITQDRIMQAIKKQYPHLTADRYAAILQGVKSCYS